MNSSEVCVTDKSWIAESKSLFFRFPLVSVIIVSSSSLFSHYKGSFEPTLLWPFLIILDMEKHLEVKGFHKLIITPEMGCQ